MIRGLVCCCSRRESSSDGSKWQKVVGIQKKKGLGRSVQSVEAGSTGVVHLWTSLYGALVLSKWSSSFNARGGKRAAETGSRLGICPGARLDWAPVRAQCPGWWPLAGRWLPSIHADVAPSLVSAWGRESGRVYGCYLPR